MGKSGHFIHRVVKTENTTFNTAYASDKRIDIRLNDIQDGSSTGTIKRKLTYDGNINLIRLKGTITGGATCLTLKGYEDSTGNKLLLPPSSSSLETSIDGTEVACSFFVNVFHASTSDDIYLFCKTNTGEFTVNEVQVTWFE
jgi:outer membrane cobalamin receptor